MIKFGWNKPKRKVQKQKQALNFQNSIFKIHSSRPRIPLNLVEENKRNCLQETQYLHAHKKKACSLAATIPTAIQINPTQAKQLCKSMPRSQVRRSPPTDVVAREHKTTQQRQTETQGVLQPSPLTMNTIPYRRPRYLTRTE